MLGDRVPPRPGTPPDELLELFLGHVKDIGLELYPAQEQALLELFEGHNVVLSTPTGSGKSLVALALHFLALSEGKRSIYTAPIKALVGEKFFALCRDFGPDRVGMLTGDAAVNRDAPVLCCTAEILANFALREGKDAPVDCAIVDEFHYYADRERGAAWQIPLLVLERTQFLLMSATLGPTEGFERELTKLTHRPTVTVSSAQRPVPLDYEYRETPLHETISKLVETGRSPVYVVNFTQRAAAETAQNFMSLDFLPKDRKKVLAEELGRVRFDTPYGREMKRFLAHGIGVHHAGLLPKYRLLVEKLAQKGLLAIVSGTDTLGVGVNIPIRTVLFTQLCKYDGEKTAILAVRDFQQIAGRAGRRGFDEQGFVVAQAPPHVIENLKLEAKAAGDPVKLKRIVRRKPPDRGYVHWDRATFQRLVSSRPEPLVSRFRVSHGMLLEVLQRPNGCREVARLVHRSHERRPQRRIFGREARAMFETLVGAGIIEVDEGTRRVRANVDLQEDFSLHHALSLWLVDTVDRLDRESPTYALDVLTLVESILEDPDFVLRQQLGALKTAKMAELKMAGVEYEERIAELDKLEHPKPLRELVYETFNAFARLHPWVRGDDVRPKAVAREMVERFMDFNEYVREYELGRAEGTLLRYLSDVYKALLRTVPSETKTPEVEEIEVFLRAIVRAVDSSLIDEWERIRDPGQDAEQPAPQPEQGEADVTSDVRGFTVLVRNAMFQLLRALARKEWAAASELATGMAPDQVASAMEPFFAEHSAIRLDAAARAPDRIRIEQHDATWSVVQVVSDREGDDDWAVFASIDVAASATEARPILRLDRIGR
ncbi:MAG: DEAD/DEAH box helicase [Polyangiaceae bacterium]